MKTTNQLAPVKIYTPSTERERVRCAHHRNAQRYIDWLDKHYQNIPTILQKQAS